MRLVVFCLGFTLVSPPAQSCSTFAIPQAAERIVGKSYDWHFGHGAVMINKRNMRKQAAVMGATPVTWKSKYGSVTFNQLGLEFPMGGMNEKGLVVEVSWLQGTQEPTQKTKLPAINEVQWIQYILDTSATLFEAIQQAQKVRMKRFVAPVHYFACDRTGHCASFEYLPVSRLVNKKRVTEGRLVITSSYGRIVSDGNGMEYLSDIVALTNSTMPYSMRELSTYKSFGGKADLPQATDTGSIERFVRLHAGVRLNYDGKKPAVKQAFDLLESVRQGRFTKWHIVYESRNGVVHFKAPWGFQQKTFDLKSFDFSCKKPVQVLDMTDRADGNVQQEFADYTDKFNGEMIDLNRDPIPGLYKRMAKAYPKMGTRCQE